MDRGGGAKVSSLCGAVPRLSASYASVAFQLRVFDDVGGGCCHPSLFAEMVDSVGDESVF